MVVLRGDSVHIHVGYEFTGQLRILMYSNILWLWAKPSGSSNARFSQRACQSHSDRTLLKLCGDGELSAGQLIEKLGIEQANASQHLAILRAKMIVGKPQGGQPGFLFHTAIASFDRSAGHIAAVFQFSAPAGQWTCWKLSGTWPK